MINLFKTIATRLTHLFLMHPFSTPWKQKRYDFLMFSKGLREGALGTNVSKKLFRPGVEGE